MVSYCEASEIEMQSEDALLAFGLLLEPAEVGGGDGLRNF